MNVRGGAWTRVTMIAGCLVLALQAGLAQNPPKKAAASSPQATRTILVEKAHALESRGRPDMAIQLWQQILLSDSKNTDALAGLARDYKLMGSADKAREALEHLRSVNPKDPNIPKIEALASTRTQSEKLRQAGELTRQGKPEEAMRIYREQYGDHPPDGDIALAYYQTLYGTASGKQEAVAAMRAMVARNPGDPRFAVALATMLTFDNRSRGEGIRILKEHPKDLNAEAALRQALIWDAANPASAVELRQYLKDHPQDTELVGHLKEEEAQLARMNSGIARTPAERAAFAALNAHKLEEAQTRFSEILEREPNNGRVAAGMGFLRMQQKNFGGAISYLTQAEQNGYKTGVVQKALTDSRFWYIMDEATQAFEDNRLDVAATKYRAALGMRPRSPEALLGLAGMLTGEQQYPAAAGVYEQLIKVQPGSSPAWRGLFLAYARDGQNQKALALSARFPAPVRAALARDPEYLRTLAAVYRAQGRSADAQRVLAQALSLPFPANDANLKTDTKLEYGGILMEAKRFDQAAVLYAQIVKDDPGNLPAWMGLISAHHELGQDNQAIIDAQNMPQATYEAALADPGFLSMLGAIYQQANQFEVAQGLLERSARLQIAAGGKPSSALQLQLAAIYLQRNNAAQAYELYRQVLANNPDRADAWKGLITTLQTTNREGQALQEIAQIPAQPRKELESEIDFLQIEASLYAATGDMRHAVETMNRVQAHYAKLKILPPPDVDVQNAWLLFNTHGDRALYPALMRLGGRRDLSVAQREMVQNIWANWSVRRAGIAMDNGNFERAVEILDAASQAFPDNMAVRKAVAGGYAHVGRAKEALALYKTVPMQDATAGDFAGAVGAALAANDKNQAEVWLRQALERYPRDPVVLTLAARYEQARGDNQRAADYYRAALAAMPRVSATDKLAHALVYPEQNIKARRAVTAADLQHLLDPDYEPFAKTTKVPALPAYGADPYNGSAPVILGPSRPASQAPAQAAPQDWTSGPASKEDALPASPNTNPAVTTIPAAQPANPQLFFQQSAKQIDRPGYVDPEYPELRLRKVSSQSSFEQAPLQAQVPDGSYAPPPQLSASAPHSLASDAWKGLIFSLIAGSKYDEALRELQKIPADVQRQLEADVEFEQGEANLYAAVGDTPRAMEYLNRVEDFYLLRKAATPSGMEIQHAWLLYNVKDDCRLYPVLLRLDSRQDLTAAQREQVETLWADWAVRRANFAMDNGYTLRGVQILEAASGRYPDSLIVRRAVAGAYTKVGRAADALTLFKAIPMQDATAGDFQGAIGAALAATDMAQAEAWLRQALDRFPGDPQILGLAARFEQARGNNRRASDFWRAALAVLPPGSTVQSLERGLVYPPGSYQAPAPGDLKHLLDPHDDPTAPSPKLPPLPSYRTPSGTSIPQAAAPDQNQWLHAPSANPLPLPSLTDRGSAPSGLPIYAPQSLSQGKPSSQPVLIEQSATQEAVIQPAMQTTEAGKQAPAKSRAKSRTAAQSQPPDGYTGTVKLPPGEETIDSTDDTSSLRGRNPGTSRGLRITSQPVDSACAQALALFAEQTDEQLTEGSAMAIHTPRNAQALPPAHLSGVNSGTGQYTEAQYTPSAQDAASGAYSAPRGQSNPQPGAQTGKKPAAAGTAPPAVQHKKKKKSSGANPQAAPTLGNAPVVDNSSGLPGGPAPESSSQVEIPGGAPAQTAPAPSSDTGLTDEELEQRNLPPLRGPWVRVQRDAHPISPREEAEMQLRAIESSYSGWLGGTGVLNYRSGDLGYSHLAALEAPFEASMPLGYNARLTIVAKPVFLDSGQADGTSVITVQEATTGVTCLVTIPQPIGTYAATNSASSGTCPTNFTTTFIPPAQQNAAGLAGELQLAFPHLAVAGGYTPAGFLVGTVTARAQWRPGNGPFTFSVVRDSVKDSQLSYAGLRDPAGNKLGQLGQIWGGVIANQGNVQYAHGDAMSGFYFGVGGQYLTGYTVETNNRIDGNGGAYWRLYTSPEYGNLSIGANFFAMHYANDQNAFTHGMGGYFSPQAYVLANVPVSWIGHYETHWHYNIVGGFGVQGFQESTTPLWLLAVDKALQTSQNNPYLPATTIVGGNYDVRGQVAYQISPHWFAGGFASANNTRNYAAASAGFYVRFMFRSQPSTATGPTGLFPVFPPNDGLRPFSVP